MQDIRDHLFRDIAQKRFRAVLTAERSGVLSGAAAALECARALGLELELCRREGDELSHGAVFANFSAAPKQLAQAEEQLIGVLAKASGIATAARTAVQLADGRAKIVSGAWKKMPPQLKELVRGAVAAGGAEIRIARPPMVYLDKNFVRMLGSVSAAMAAAEGVPGVRIVQLRGDLAPIGEETRQAVQGGADILMVDTGAEDDAAACAGVLQAMGCRDRVLLAFAGNIRLGDIPAVLDRTGADILDIGKAIVDAPLLDMRLDVVGEA